VSSQSTTPRILFVAECVTLAHFGRCIALAEMLDLGQYEVTLAADPRYLSLAPDPLPFAFRSIRSIPSAEFNAALAKGKPLYSAETLAAYVEEDLALLEEVKPDLVIGDFRLSLAVSAPKAGVLYASLINAYWSPYAKIRYPVPDLPFVRVLGVDIGQRIFDLVRPIAFALHAVPLNKVRRRNGLSSLGYDLRQVYSWADHVLYPDFPDAIPTQALPSNHHFIGPVLWSAQCDLPDWWDKLPTDKPIVYVTLGSSGRADVLPVVLEALAELPVTVIASTAGSEFASKAPPNAWLSDYLPGDLATERASVLICNGGSLTTYQAVESDTSVIGITTNMDQMLNMQIVERMQAGEMFRVANLDGTTVRKAVAKWLDREVQEEGLPASQASQTQSGFIDRVSAILS
jgi:UDP:flavonoid glycosyltransferase YjiC (YdhE family)